MLRSARQFAYVAMIGVLLALVSAARDLLPELPGTLRELRAV